MNEVLIHQTAEVNENAIIGKGTKIWNNAQIRERAIIGENCNIGKNVYIDFDVVIGSNVKIQNNVNVYNGVIIEDDVFCGPSMTFTNDMYPRAFNNNWKVVKTVVKKGASFGAGCVVVCGNTIGKYAMIGSGSVVCHNVEDYALMVGVPAKKIGYVCKCGHRLDKNMFCKECKKVIKR